MEFLVFQLQAPLAAWGDTAVGEFRPSGDYPSQSALFGLLAAALGIRREDEAAYDALVQGFGFVIGVQSAGQLLRDYHTAQVAPQSALKKRPLFTRRDELAIPRQDLSTILSTREYRQNVAYLVAIQQTDAAALYTLPQLAAALNKPRFVLYLGRKSCPLATPVFPLVLETASALDAMKAYSQHIDAALNQHKDKDKWDRLPLAQIAPVNKLVWGEGANAGAAASLSVSRKDRTLNRQRWQFADRTEHIALLEKGS